MASRSASFVGLLMYAFMPEAIHFSLVDGTALAVRAMMGILAANSEDKPIARISLAASNPLLTGMAQSIRIRSIFPGLVGAAADDATVDVINNVGSETTVERTTVGSSEFMAPGVVVMAMVSSDDRGDINGGDAGDGHGDVNVAQDKGSPVSV